MPVYIEESTGRGVVSCDWFTLSSQLTHPRDGSPIVPPKGWNVLPMAPTAVWGERYFVMDSEGNKVATILCNPRTPKIANTSCNVQIANRYLYYDDFEANCDRVCDMLPMAIHGLNRVDLCCDFEMTPELYKTYMALATKKARIKALHDSVVWWKTLPTNMLGDGEKLREIPNQINWGGQDSTFKWKIYYKWLELATAPAEEKKPWIIDLWNRMGFSEKHVWRCEVSITKPNSLCKKKGVKIKAYEWYNDRVRLFSDLYTDKFVVRENQGHADRRNDRRLPFLEIVGKKSIRHAMPSLLREGSDPEKRLTCKLWQELVSGDTQCNEELVSMIQSSLGELLQRPSNVWVIQRMYNVDIETIANAISCTA